MLARGSGSATGLPALLLTPQPCYLDLSSCIYNIVSILDVDINDILVLVIDIFLPDVAICRTFDVSFNSLTGPFPLNMTNFRWLWYASLSAIN